jgi:hypothetical protein
MDIFEDVVDEEAKVSPSDPLEAETLILLHALTSFSAPQTLKLIGYIKHRKGVEWLRTLSPILMEFKDLTINSKRRDNNINSKASQ